MSKTSLRRRCLPASALVLVVTATAAAEAQQSNSGGSLPPLVVPGSYTETSGGLIDGYQAITTTAGSKTETPITELPQSIQVLTGPLLKEQKPLTASEALYNVSGVQPIDSLQFNGLDGSVRGFVAEQLLDGLPNYYNAGDRDSLVDVERIEALKGPTALLYGGSVGASVGGAINVVSKQPLPEAAYSGGLIFGSYGYAAPFIDLNQPLTADGTLLARLTGEYGRSDSFIDVLESERYSLNPALTLALEDTTVVLKGRVSRLEQQDYAGLPLRGTVLPASFSFADSYFIGNEDVPKTKSDLKSLTLSADHRFDETWSASLDARASKSRLWEPSQFFLSNEPLAGSIFVLWNGLLSQEMTEVSVNPNLQAEFTWGPSETTLLAGMEYDRTTDDGYLDADPAALVDVTNPLPPAYAVPSSAFISSEAVYRTLGGYLQVQSTLYDEVHLLAGLRLANIRIDHDDLLTGSSYVSDETRLLPRVGAVWEVFDGVSLFASYSEGFRALTYATNILEPEPEESRQYEAGIKLDLAFGLSGTVSLFDLKREGVPTTDPSNPLLSIQTGEQRTRGIEVDLVWQPDENWSLLASYALLDGQILEDEVFESGNQLDFLPRHSGRLWVSRRFTEGSFNGLTLGAGLYAAGKQQVDLANSAQTDAYVRFDAAMSYDAGPVTLGLTVKNLTDADYYVPYSYLGSRVAPGEPLSVYASITTNF